MVFGMRLFGGGSPSKATVDGDTPRVADRVEAPHGASAASSADARVEPGESDIALSSVPSAVVDDGLSAVPSVPSVPRMAIPEDNAAAETLAASRRALVPLNAIPDFVINDHPELKLGEYDMARGAFCANAIAMPHNAVRLEIADMWSDILPSMSSRPISALTRDDAADLQHWWAGFARFALTTSLVDDYIVDLVYKDIIEDFDKDAQDIKKLRRKYQEKNTVTLEIVCRRMGHAVEEFATDMSADNMQRLNAAWAQLAATLADIYRIVEEIVGNVDRWRREEIAEHKDLEKSVAKIYTNRKRWGDNDAKRGEMIVVLTRWVGSEHLMRQWMQRNLTKRELRSIDKWMDDYRANRLQIIDRFHQRRAM